MKNAFQDRYKKTKSKIKEFLNAPERRILLVSGENGIGKSYQVETIASEAGYTRFDYRNTTGSKETKRSIIWIGPGRYGPGYLYQLFYENNGSVFHFEDNIFQNPHNRSFLTALVSAEYSMFYPKGSPPPGFPRDFQFKGGIIITTHQPLETLTDDIRDAVQILDMRIAPEPENMIRLLELEMDSIVKAFNKKLPGLAINVEEGKKALELYREIFNERRAKEEIRIPYMVSIFFSFEMLRTLTSKLYNIEEKKQAINLSFTDVPGNVSGVYLNQDP